MRPWMLAAATLIAIPLAGPSGAKESGPAQTPARDAPAVGQPLAAAGHQLSNDPLATLVGIRLFQPGQPSVAGSGAPPSPGAAALPPPEDPLAAGRGGLAAPAPGGTGLARMGKAGQPPVLGEGAGGVFPPSAPQGGVPARVEVRFTPSAEISQTVRQRILERVSPQLTEARRVIAAGQPWQEFDALLASYGYSSRDLGDVLTAYYVMCWEVATGGDASREVAGIAAVRRAVGVTLANNPRVVGMGDAERQVTAENLAFFAVYAASGHNVLRAQGRGVELQALRDEVSSTLQAQGIAIRNYRLTPAGFVPG